MMASQKSGAIPIFYLIKHPGLSCDMLVIFVKKCNVFTREHVVRGSTSHSVVLLLVVAS